MKSALFALLFYHPAAAALRGQQSNPSIYSSNNYETIFIEAKDVLRRVPDNAPPNADEHAHAKLMNERDIFDPSIELETDGTLYSPPRSKGKRIKGAELMAEGIHHVIITPEQMVDCDIEKMNRLGMDTSTCANIEPSMKSGGLAFGASKEQEEKDLESQLGEEDYDRELMIERGEEAVFRTDERRLNPGRTIDIGIFEPLKCNLDADNVASILPSGEECDANPDGLMSSLVASAGSGPVVIPCGQCIKVRLPKDDYFRLLRLFIKLDLMP